MRRKYFSESEKLAAIATRKRERYHSDPAARAITLDNNHRSYRKNEWRFRPYGITKQNFDAMLTAQNGQCRLCGEVRDLKIDHAPGTRTAVRGLLCQGCNVRLGWYERRRDAIAEYLSV